MFKGLKKKYGDAKASAKQWKDTRVGFGKGIWQSFSEYWKKLRQGKVNTKPMPFDQAVRSWGLEPTERNITRAKKSIAFMCVFFYIIAVWCGFYLFRVLFAQLNFLAAAACLMGLGTGAFVGTVNLWRWKVLARRKYTPFLAWLKGGMRI